MGNVPSSREYFYRAYGLRLAFHHPNVLLLAQRASSPSQYFTEIDRIVQALRPGQCRAAEPVVLLSTADLLLQPRRGRLLQLLQDVEASLVTLVSKLLEAFQEESAPAFDSAFVPSATSTGPGISDALAATIGAAQRLRDDDSDGALHFNDAQASWFGAQLSDAENAAVNRDTAKRDDSSWRRYWAPITATLGTNPIRDYPTAVSGLDAGLRFREIMLLVYVLIMILTMMSPRCKSSPAPQVSSALHVLLGVRRIHSRMHEGMIANGPRNTKLRSHSASRCPILD